MLQLNEKCLKAILSKLSIPDQINLTKVCMYLEHSVKTIWARQYKIVSTNDSNVKYLEYNEYAAFFMFIDPELDTLIIDEKTHIGFRSFRCEMAFYMSFKFPSLRRLECDDDRFDIDDLRLVLQRWPKLEILRLPNRIMSNGYMKDSRNYWEALQKCGSIQRLNLQETNRLDNIPELIQEMPTVVHIYLSDLIAERPERLMVILDPLIQALESQPERSALTITSGDVSAELLMMESYILQNVLRVITDQREETRPMPPYLEFRFATQRNSEIDDDFETTETEMEDITEHTENTENTGNTENSEKS